MAVLLKIAKERCMGSSKENDYSCNGILCSSENELTTETDTIMDESEQHDVQQMQLTKKFRQYSIYFIKPRSKQNTVFPQKATWHKDWSADSLFGSQS